MGEVAGVKMWVVQNKGGLVDLRFAFTVKVGNQIAIYGFDKNSSAANQKRADDALEAAKKLTSNKKDKLSVIGTDATNAHTQQIPANANGLVPNDIGPARILIGKVGKGSYAVRLSIPQKGGTDKIVLEVPFDGNPGNLKGDVFEGEVMFLTDGSQDVAKVELGLMDIIDSP